MKVLVCGGRKYTDAETIDKVLSTLDITILAHGGATGADSLAGEWAHRNHIPCNVFSADWRKYGKGAGPERNQRMLDQFKPDLVLAFPGGRGTADMVKRALAAGVTCRTLFEMLEE